MGARQSALQSVLINVQVPNKVMFPFPLPLPAAPIGAIMGPWQRALQSVLINSQDPDKGKFPEPDC